MSDVLKDTVDSLPEISKPLYMPSENAIYTVDTRHRIRNWAVAFTKIIGDRQALEDEKEVWDNSLRAILDNNDPSEFDDIQEYINCIFEAELLVPVFITEQGRIIDGADRVAKAYLMKKNVIGAIVSNEDLEWAKITDDEDPVGPIYSENDNDYSVGQIIRSCEGGEYSELDPLPLMLNNEDVWGQCKIVEIVDMIVEGITLESGDKHLLTLREVWESAKALHPDRDNSEDDETLFEGF